MGRNFELLVGIYPDANVRAARQPATKHPGSIATVLPNRVKRYFSTSLL